MSYARAPQKSPVEADTKLIWLQQMGEDVAAGRRLLTAAAHYRTKLFILDK